MQIQSYDYFIKTYLTSCPVYFKTLTNATMNEETHPNDESLVQCLARPVVYDGGQLAQLRAIVKHIQEVLPGQICYT